MSVKQTTKDGGMASGILRATARFLLLALLVGLGVGIYLLVKIL